MNYNFVIFASKLDCYKYMYKDAKGIENVKFYSGSDGLFSKGEKLIHSIHVSRRLNRVISVPFKNVWYRLLVKRVNNFSNHNPICFIWSTHFMKDIENGMIECIRRELPDSKHVFQFTDAKFLKHDYPILKEKMDLLTIFDKKMAKEYDIYFLPNVYPQINKIDEAGARYDICFVGNDRGREELLGRIAISCKEKSINAAFFIKKDGERKYEGYMNYITEYMSYDEVLAILNESKCVLELKIEPFNTCSLRVQEAVILNKKILTNNPNVYHMPCCESGKWISYFEDIEDIDWEFIKTGHEKVDYNYKGEYSLQRYLDELKNVL